MLTRFWNKFRAPHRVMLAGVAKRRSGRNLHMSREFDYSDFSLDEKKLPRAIEERALTSGNYPYDGRMKRKVYEKELVALQLELLKLQTHCRNVGERIVILFEGRDTAGKGGSIKRFMEHLNPRHARAIALSKPTKTERGQWYFQRYITHLPTSGDMVLFDRSWYNRAGVERVMGFCDESQLANFLREAPQFEGLLVRDGVRLFKVWLTIGREMQLKRFHARRHDPLKRWKLSPIDLAALDKWEEYTAARNDMFAHTHTKEAPWTVIRSNDKRRARLNVMRLILSSMEYADKDGALVGSPDPLITGNSEAFFASA